MGFPPYAQGQWHLCTTYTVFHCSGMCLCDFPDHTFRGVISSLTCLWVQWTAKTFLIYRTVPFLVREGVLLKGKGKASSFLERKSPKMRQTHSASLFTWEWSQIDTDQTCLKWTGATSWLCVASQAAFLFPVIQLCFLCIRVNFPFKWNIFADCYLIRGIPWSFSIVGVSQNVTWSKGRY